MNYKTGDRVRIKSLYWYNRYTNGTEVNCKYYPFSCHMKKYCGQIMTISIVGGYSYSMIEDDGKYSWTDEMIEGLVEEEIKPGPKFKVGDKVILDPYPCKITDVHWRDSLHGFVYTVRGTDFGKTVKEDELVFDERPTPTTDKIIKNIKADWNNFKNRYNLPNDYHFVDKDGNEINISEIVLEKKKPEYPKTYEACLKVLGYDDRETYCIFHTGADERLFEALYRLKVCRDAYWKIAGDEMGLGKHWKPQTGVIYHYMPDAPSYIRNIFPFPTEDMRDAFYENFKELIEECKELL